MRQDALVTTARTEVDIAVTAVAQSMGAEAAAAMLDLSKAVVRPMVKDNK